MKRSEIKKYIYSPSGTFFLINKFQILMCTSTQKDLSQKITKTSVKQGNSVLHFTRLYEKSNQIKKLLVFQRKLLFA